MECRDTRCQRDRGVDLYIRGFWKLDRSIHRVHKDKSRKKLSGVHLQVCSLWIKGECSSWNGCANILNAGQEADPDVIVKQTDNKSPSPILFPGFS